jgi:ribosomal protein S18 acetylase RimI-like enzyme
MAAASLLKSAAHNGLQPVDLSRHLGGIAELIELCFRAELDAAGRGLIREMHLLSRAGPALRVLQVLLMGQQPWSLGYVWVEGGRVVGTVSTQRAAPRSPSWLIANVAVHPDHRRHGIALAMMRATLDLIRGEGGREAILQVDDDNLAAVTLYRGLGFSKTTTRTNWVRSSHLAPPPFVATGHDLRLRGPKEWAEQFALASMVRPEGLRWGHPLRPEDFRPGTIKRLDQLIAGRAEEHWVLSEPARGPAGGQLIGSLTIQFNTGEGDRLGLLVHPRYAGQLERPLLVRGLRRLGRRPWQTRVEYDADDAAATQVLTELGFQAKRSLRWMRASLRS